MTFYHASFIGPFSFFLFLLYILPLSGRVAASARAEP